jgi:hypothetical protein
MEKMILDTTAAELLGLPTGVTRAEIAAAIVNYCKENGMIDADGETLHLKGELAELLELANRDYEYVTVANIHRFLGALDLRLRGRKFNDPVLLHDKLAVFLGKTPGSTATPSEITRSFVVYCREKGLVEGRVIHPDATLMKLLDLDPRDYISILNLNRYLRELYVPV